MVLIVGGLAWGLFDAPSEPDPVGGPEMMRRLTEEQYRASITDIFSPEIPVNARFEAPVRSQGLIATGTSEAGMSPYAIEQYENAAESVFGAVLSKANRKKFVPCTPVTQAEFDRHCAEEFVGQTGLKLFRRPLTADELTRYVDAAARAFQEVGDLRDITWDERPYLDWLNAMFAHEDYRVPDLMRAIALSDNFFIVTRRRGQFVRREIAMGAGL